VAAFREIEFRYHCPPITAGNGDGPAVEEDVLKLQQVQLTTAVYSDEEDQEGAGVEA
jgi:hypothetical protein